MSNIPNDIEAQITLIGPELGGRKGQFFNGMRPGFYYDENYWDCVLRLLSEPIFAHNQTIMVYFGFTNPSAHLNRLGVGKDFVLMDGFRVIANGRVTAILDLEKSAARQKEHSR